MTAATARSGGLSGAIQDDVCDITDTENNQFGKQTQEDSCATPLNRIIHEPNENLKQTRAILGLDGIDADVQDGWLEW